MMQEKTSPLFLEKIRTPVLLYTDIMKKKIFFILKSLQFDSKTNF